MEKSSGSDISFRDVLMAGRGQTPVEAHNVTLERDGEEMVAVISEGAVFSYATTDLYDPKCGTVDLWVKLRQGGEVEGCRTLWSVDGDPGQSNTAAIRVWGAGNEPIGWIIFSNDFAINEGLNGIMAPIGWKADEWHHVVACWDEATHCRALYVDSDCLGAQVYTRAMPKEAKFFHIGHMPDHSMGCESAIKQFTITQDVTHPHFVKASKQRAEYYANYKRLEKDYSLDRVAALKIEVDWHELTGMSTPLSYRVPVEAAHHPDFVFVQPDLSISLGNAEGSLGLGFALGDPVVFPDMEKVSRKLLKNYQPIVESRWKSGEIILEQTAFAILPGDEETVSGKEDQYAVIRISISNRGSSHRYAPLSVFVGKMNGTQNAGYNPFLAPTSRWETESLGITHQDSALTIADRTLLVYKCNAPTPVDFQDEYNGFTNCLAFDVVLKPGETRTVDFVVSSNYELFSYEQTALMKQIDFDSALHRASAYWDRQLDPSMKLATPDRRLNNVYKAIVLSGIAGMVQYRDEPWRVPIQSHNMPYVWPWEFAHLAGPLASIGYHKKLLPSFAYFTERQAGIGKHSVDKGPEAEVKSNVGCYTGSLWYWTNETGSVLFAMGEFFRYSRDVKWLKENSAGILAAWNFLQNARSGTRILQDDGNKVDYYGLMPAGRSSDITGPCHEFTFTDVFTWLGMSGVAWAFKEAGLPEADRLLSEADEYRQCILDVIDREQFVSPETGLLLISNIVGYKKGQCSDIWTGSGPQQLFFAGILSPTDKRFETMLEHIQRRFGLLMGLMQHYKGDSEWYINQTERGYYMMFLARGEYEKALLVLYSNLIYGMSNDTYQTCERFNIGDPNFAPFQPNASGNGRDIDMIRRMVIDEQDPGILWLLRGCPRRWFARRKKIVVENATTLFGKMAIRTKSKGDMIIVDIKAPDRDMPSEIRLVVRHPNRKPISSATVNGEPAKIERDIVVITAPRGRIKVVCSF